MGENMKLKLNELNANPFKKEINKGKLNEETITKIRSNLKELGLMGALPVFKKDGKHYLIAGHHRTEALKREFGKDFEVEVVVHDYSEDAILRGMVVENLTQRSSDDLMEITDNLAVVRKHLKQTMRSTVERINEGHIPGQKPEAGSIRQISDWLNKNGEVMSLGKIQTYLAINDNLDRSLLKKTEFSEGGQIEEGKLSVTEAMILSRLDKEHQKPMKEILDDADLTRDEKARIVGAFNEAPEDVKEKILSGEVPVNNIPRDIVVDDDSEMARRFNKRTLELINEMRTLRKAIYQFRKERLFEHFDVRQRSAFSQKLFTIKQEYGELVGEIEKSLEVLK